MRKLFFMALLAVTSNQAMAQWLKAFTSDDNAIVFYAAPASKESTSVDKAKIWVLHDLNAPQSINSKAYLSIVSQREYNCKDKQDRLLYSSYHSGNMGGREVVQTVSENEKWSEIKANSANAALWEIACHSVVVHQNH